MKTAWSLVAVTAVLAMSTVFGCRDFMPHSATLFPGDVERRHAEPAEGGYYTNWDPYAATVEVTPVVAVNPVGTQHVLVATVRDHEGQPLPNRRVEWILPEGGVGSLVEVDESGWRASRGHKISERFAVTHTNNGPHVLTRGNDDPADNVRLERGQTWAVISSAVEGTTHVIAYVPGIHDWSKHKVFVQKHWYDVAWKIPPAAVNPIGTDHRLVTTVTQHSDGAPLAGYEVTYTILDGPAAVLVPGNKTTAAVKTNAQGLAMVTLRQSKAVEGVNRIRVDITRPANEKCCKPAAHIATAETKKTWVGPKIAIRKTAPAQAILGQPFTYQIVVSNPGKAAATNVTVTDELPAGIEYRGSRPEATVRGQNLSWKLGTLAAGAKTGLRVTVHATKTGTFTNCADVKADHGLSARDCAETKVVQARLTLRKEGPAEVLICEPITYRITVTNAGDAPARNVVVKDELPDGLEGRDGNRTFQGRADTLAPGASRAFTVPVKATKPGPYKNTATATADGGLTASDSATTVVRQPVLVVTKKGPPLRFVDRPAEFTITVKNTGDGPARNTVLVDTIPDGAEFVEASEGARRQGNTVTWRLGTLEPGKSATATISLRRRTRGEIRNTARATALCTKDDDTAVTAIKGIPAILLECVDIQDPIEVGAQTTYRITVTNQGSADGTGIVVTCTLPAEEEYVSATGATKATAEGKTVAFAPLKSLAPGREAEYTVRVRGTAAGDVRFRVSLNSDQMTSPATETESTRIYE